MNPSGNTSIKASIQTLFLVLLAIFPVSNTIALRNVLVVLLIAAVLGLLVFRKSAFAHPLGQSLRHMPWPITLWVGFLVLFPLWAPDAATAWQNLGGQWLEALLAGFIGYAVFHLLGRKGPGLLALGFASALPLLLHLVLCLAAMLGMLDPQFFADPTIGTLWQSLTHPQAYASNVHWTVQALFGGFRGIEPMHGNLGYPACQAICLFCAAWALSGPQRNYKVQAAAMVGIALCFLSILIAQSRGAIVYAILILLLSYVLFRFRMGVDRPSGPAPARVGLRLRKLGLAALLSVAFVFLAFQYIKHDPRWFSMADSMEAGFSIEDPAKVLCDGLDAGTQAAVRNRLAGRDPKYVDRVIEGLNSDGGRILVLRAGFSLMLENPLGLDGSRQSYRKRIEAKCGHVPAMQFAHSHDSWIDLTLALGWPGTLVFAILMMFFAHQGFTGMQSRAEKHWAMALFLLSTFWILRGFADSVYREHYLQMQFLLLMFLFGRRQLPAPEQA